MDQRSYSFTIAETYIKSGLQQQSIHHICQALQKCHNQLTSSQQKILVKAYRKIIEPMKKSLKALLHKIQSMEQKGKENIRKLLIQTKNEKCEQLLGFVRQFVASVDQYLGYGEAFGYSTILCLKVKGDLYRAMWEIHEMMSDAHSQQSLKMQTQRKQNECLQQSENAYRSAIQKSSKQGIGYDKPLILGIHLNYSILLYDMKQDIAQAFKIASLAVEQAQKTIELQDWDYRSGDRAESEEFLKILDFLKANISLWGEDQIEN